MKVALALRLALLLLIVGASTTSAQESQEVKLDPAIAKWEKQIAVLEEQQSNDPQPENAILFYGSSSIARWDNLPTDMAPWPTIKRGYGGARLPDVIHYAPRILGPHLGADNPQRCYAVVIFVANDIRGKENDATPAEVANRFGRLHQWIRTQDPSVPLFWIEVTPTLKRWSVWPEISDATEQIVELIEADENSHFIATAGAYLGLEGKPREDFFVADKIHLNETGYRLWSGLIKANLNLTLGPVKPWGKPEPQTESPSRKPAAKLPAATNGATNSEN